jgi:hypothetical protein
VKTLVGAVEMWTSLRKLRLAHISTASIMTIALLTRFGLITKIGKSSG